MQRVPKKPSIAKADLQNSTARLMEDNVVVWLMEADCFRYKCSCRDGSNPGVVEH